MPKSGSSLEDRLFRGGARRILAPHTPQVIRAEVEPAAVDAIKELDRTRDDLKSGWHRAEDGTRIHWAFAEFDIQGIDSLPEMLRPFRFEPEVAPNRDVDGVLLIGFG